MTLSFEKAFRASLFWPDAGDAAPRERMADQEAAQAHE
jgi:hypothetical protein